MTIAQRCQQVFDALWSKGTASIREVAERTGMSKSSVHRHKQAIEQRQLHLESALWETPEGYQWLVRLVSATIYHFGIQHGIGSASLSEYFKLLRLQQRIGVSAESLRKLEVKLSEQIIAYEQQQSLESQASKPIEICVGSDEVFFDDPVLVMLELSSGFLLLESKASNRQYSTWEQHAALALPPEQFRCRSAVSDQAKALIKLASDGLGCRWVPDLFDALWNLGKPIGSTFGRRLAKVNKQLHTLEAQLHKAQHKGKPTEALESQRQVFEAEHTAIKEAQQTYHQALQQISTQVHPFAIEGSAIQTAVAVQSALETPLKTLERLGETWAIAKAQTAIESFRHQIPGIAMGVSGWWSWVLQELEAQALSEALVAWLLCGMLPWLYWDQQAHRTKQPHLKKRYQQAAQQAYQALIDDAFTQTLSVDEQRKWWSWSLSMIAKFQRTSSAVEGRNGYLSHVHHTHRGIDQKTLQVLKTIHNYGLKRSDGTTAAQRLFGRAFPELFEAVLEQMGELPQPRRSKKSKQPQMPTLSAVPA